MNEPNYVADVKDFHLAAGHPIGTVPRLLESDRATLRIKLVVEEAKEFVAAVKTGDLVEMADACADLIYVTIGAAIEAGIPLAEVWKEVQRTNMLKTTGPKRSDGKTLKPSGWQPPDIGRILLQHSWVPIATKGDE